MASIRVRTKEDGSKRYQIYVRRDGFPPVSKSFSLPKEAKAEIAEVEQAISSVPAPGAG